MADPFAQVASAELWRSGLSKPLQAANATPHSSGPCRWLRTNRIDASLARLRSDGIEARGQVGDSEPLQAMEDALRTFGANEIIISTHPPGRSHWLEQDLVEQARERFAVPITHVVVDLEAERD